MYQSNRAIRLALLWLLMLLATGCTAVPEGLQPVKDFKLQQYLGKWYEIARLDHSFERNLEQVSAQYSLREDGGVAVLNRGFNVKTGRWEEADGKAYFVAAEDVGHLKVSFFGPFYNSYVVFELELQNYQYALVCGPNRDYLWLLSRQPHIDQQLQQQLLARMAEAGFATDALLWVNQR